MPWSAKATGGYDLYSSEAEGNALEIANVLRAQGWTDNAIAGTLGNMQFESQLNPWIWQNNDVLASTDTYLIEHSSVHGYGLNQFTPAGTYINSTAAQGYPGYGPNFSDRAGNPADGAAQVLWVDQHGGYIPTSRYPLSYAQYKASALSSEYLAIVWLYNYGRGGPGVEQTEAARRRYAARWYEYITGQPPGPTPGQWMITNRIDSRTLRRRSKLFKLW